MLNKNKKITEIQWHSVENGLPKTYREEIKNGNFDFQSYMLWCKNKKGMEYIPKQTFILEAKEENEKLIPIKWISYNGGEYSCEKDLNDVIYFAEMPKIN